MGPQNYHRPSHSINDPPRSTLARNGPTTFRGFEFTTSSYGILGKEKCCPFEARETPRRRLDGEEEDGRCSVETAYGFVLDKFHHKDRD